MSSNFRKSVIAKKLIRYSANIYRPILRDNGKAAVIANSVPKSGTHLLVQILEALPDVRDWANFIASTPSLTLKETKGSTSAKRLHNLASRELVGAHLFYSEEIRAAIKERGILHYFIYRDPRDIVISEVNYLTKMNRWHRLHRVLNKMDTLREGYLFSINGDTSNSDYYFPDINERYKRFEPWIDDASVMAIRFEDLRGSDSHKLIRAIVEKHWIAYSESYDLDLAVEKAIKNVNPKRSHTFRKGAFGAWRDVFDDELKDTFKERAGDLLIRLGYETDHNW